MGSGDSEIIAIVYDAYPFDTEAEAQARLGDIQDDRDMRWDDREAIVFLQESDPLVPSIRESGHYALGTLNYPYPGSDSYSIASSWADGWLPALLTDGVSGASDSGDQRFLTEDPDIPGGAPGASGSSSGAQTITLSKIKERVSVLKEELSKGDGSEEYRRCVAQKYYIDRYTRWHIDNMNPDYFRFESELASGVPVGSLVSVEGALGDLPNKTGKYWLAGEDKELFTIEVSGIEPFDWSEDGVIDSIRYSTDLSSARPLPRAEYDFYVNGMTANRVVCDGLSEMETNRFHWFITVTAPEGTLHEAFFDPVDLDGGAVGAGGENGVLNPDTFLFESDTLVERVEWKDGEAAMEFEPRRRLPDHHIDFIALDGSVALRLDFDEAADSDGTLTWGVCGKPWEEGDLLMIRISESPADLSSATNDSDCGDTPSPPESTPRISTTTRDTVDTSTSAQGG